MASATGVSFFFVLSGFVLTWSARPDDIATGFWRRRIARIYPVHLVTAGGARLPTDIQLTFHQVSELSLSG
jgi:peptidoglycan/LPS O-acetylase OafA/YrhL